MISLNLIKQLSKKTYIRFIVLLFFFILVSAPSLLEASESAQFATDTITQNVQPVAIDSATVIIDGRKLFRVVGVSTYPAKMRARLISQRIRNLAQDPSFDPATLEVKKIEGLVTIVAGEERLLNVYQNDAQLEGDISAEHLAKQLIVEQIAYAIENYRMERETDVLLKYSLRAFLRTIGLGLLLFFLFWGFRKTDQFLEGYFKGKIEELEAKSKQVVRSQQILSSLQKINRLLRLLLVWVVVYLFMNFVMGLFPWTRYLSDLLLGFIITPLRLMWEAFVNYLPSLFFLIILYFVFRYVLELTRTFFQAVDRGQIKLANFEAEWAWPTYRIVRVFVVVLAVVIAYPYIPGSGSEAFKGISILLGVIFSLGSSSFISNIIAGYMMTYRRAFRVGDRVKIGTDVGIVTDIRLLVTHLRSIKNEEIVIPNSKILNGEITNYSSLADQEGLILHTTVGIGYEVPWRQVEAMLLQAAERTPGLSQDSKPFVLQKALGDFGITYELNVFCKTAERIAQVYSDLHRNIQDSFNEYGVAIMTPHYVGDTAEPKIVPKEHWHAPPAKPEQTEKDPGGKDSE